MIKLAWKRIWSRRFPALIMILAMISIFVIIPLGIHFGQETKLTATETLEKYGRGTYDILVRPADSRTPIEEQLGVVEENYIGDGPGGISIQEWEEIKNRNDIEIAAPVASLGYFAGNRTSVELPILEHPAKFTWQYKTSDGLHSFPLDQPNTIIYFEGTEMEFVDSLALPQESDIGLMGIRMPENHYLLTAIDTESERRLTGIDFSEIYREIEPNSHEERTIEGFLETRDNAPVIPLLVRGDLNIPLHLSLTVEELGLDLDQYREKYDIPPDEPISFMNDENQLNALIQDVNEEPVLTSDDYDIDLSSHQSPFNGTYVKLTDKYQVKMGQGGSLANDTALYYTASKIDYNLSGDGIQVQKVKDGIPPLYKEVNQEGKSYLDNLDMSAPFMLWEMGSFSPPDEENKLVSSPLGIYNTEAVTTEDGTELTPTITPGSFIATPAAGVTTMEAAELIKGEEPIDAIRIRVAGIENYDKAAQQKIEKVATDLHEMDYVVDIVAGSSFKKQTMDVEGIGSVSAPWTTLGVAQALTTSFNLVSLITLILFLVFGVAWLITRILYERNTLSSENEILTKIGWPKNKIRRRNYVEQQLLITISFMISVIMLYFLPINIEKISYIISFSLWLISLVLIPILLGKNSRSITRTDAYKKWASLIHYRSLILPIMLVLIISLILIVVQAASIVSTLITARETTLGAFTLDGSFFLQVAILIATLLLTIVSISEAIHALLEARKIEFTMYHTIGWTRKMIRRHFNKEIYIWAGISIALGVVISIGILLSLNIVTEALIYSYLCSFILVILPLVVVVRMRVR